MKVNRSVLEKYLSNKFFQILINKESELKIYDYAFEKYNFPKGTFSDFLSGRKRIEEANDFALFVILDSILYNNANNHTKKLSDFFTEREISKYSVSKYTKLEEINFPLIFPMIQVCDDQWIGAIDVNMLFALQNNSLINYNPDTQRAMTKVTRGSNEVYRITLNKKAVTEITSDMTNKIYIPDTITLNISTDDELADFYYDKETHQLVIKSLKAFDINDGYHRYVSMFQAKAENSEFNYPMELRITNFDIEKSQRMIYQMDQKTQMTKQTSDSYNVYAPQNKVVQRINDSSMCNVQGFIKRDNGKIDMPTLAESIKQLYFTRKNAVDSPEQRKEIIRISKEFIEDFNILTEGDESYLDKTYTKSEIIAIAIIFNHYEGKDKSTMVNTVHQVVNSELFPNKNVFSRSNSFNSIKKKIINFIEENEND